MHTERRRHRMLKKMGPMSEEARRALNELRGELAPLSASDSFSLAKELLTVDGVTNRNPASYVEALDKRELINVEEVKPRNLLLTLTLEERLCEDNVSVVTDEIQGDSAITTERPRHSAITTERLEEEFSASNTDGLDIIKSNHDHTNFVNNTIQLNDLRRKTKVDPKRLGYKTVRSRGSVTVRSHAITHPGGYYTPRGQRRHQVFKDRLDTDIRSSFRSTDTLALPQLYSEWEEVTYLNREEAEMTSRSEFQTKQTVGRSFDTGYNSMISEISKMRLKHKSISLDRVAALKPINGDNEAIRTKTSTNARLGQTEEHSSGSAAALEIDPTGEYWDEHNIVQTQNAADSHASLNGYNKHQILPNFTSKHVLPGTSITSPRRLDNESAVFNRRLESIDFLDEQKVSTSIVAAAVVSRTNDITARAIMEQNRLRDIALLKFQQHPRQSVFQSADRHKSFRVSAIGYDCRYATDGFGLLPTVEDIDKGEDDEQELIEEYRKQAVNKCEQWLKKYYSPSRVFSLY